MLNNLTVSSSSCRRRLSSAVPKPENFRFQLKNVASEMPILRHTSATGIPVSDCFRANTICCSVNFDLFITIISSHKFLVYNCPKNSSLELSDSLGGGQFRKAGLGPLIGRRTLGALVALNDGLSTIDGGEVTSPQQAVYDPNTGKLIAENVGVIPDIEVDMRPDLVARGLDPQLDAAVKYLMEQLQKSPPKPRREIAYADRGGATNINRFLPNKH